MSYPRLKVRLVVHLGQWGRRRVVLLVNCDWCPAGGKRWRGRWGGCSLHHAICNDLLDSINCTWMKTTTTTRTISLFLNNLWGLQYMTDWKLICGTNGQQALWSVLGHVGKEVDRCRKRAEDAGVTTSPTWGVRSIEMLGVSLMKGEEELPWQSLSFLFKSHITASGGNCSTAHFTDLKWRRAPVSKHSASFISRDATWLWSWPHLAFGLVSAGSDRWSGRHWSPPLPRLGHPLPWAVLKASRHSQSTTVRRSSVFAKTIIFDWTAVKQLCMTNYLDNRMCNPLFHCLLQQCV